MIDKDEVKELLSGYFELFNSDVALFWGIDSKTNVFRINESFGNTIDKDYIDNVNLVLKPSVVTLMKKGRPLFFRDVTKSKNSNRYSYRQEAIKRGWKSLISIPLLDSAQELFAFIDLYWIQEIAPNTLIRPVEVFTKQVNKNLFGKSNANIELQKLENILAGVSNIEPRTNLKERFTYVLRMAVNMLNGIGGKLYLRIPNSDKLQLQVVAGIDSALIKAGDIITFDEGMAGEVYTSNNPLIVHDYKNYPKRIDKLKNIFETVIEVPIRVNGNPIGVLCVFDDKERRVFSEKDDIPPLQILGDIAGLIFQDREMFEALENRRRDQEMISEIIRKINSNYAFDDLLQDIAHQIKTKLNCTHCTIFFPAFDKQGNANNLFPVYCSGERKTQIMTRDFSENSPSLLWKVYKSGVGEIFHDASGHTEFAFARSNPDIKRSMMIVPISIDDRKIGIISADQDVSVWFQESDLHLVQILADHAAIVIERYRDINSSEQIIQKLIEKSHSDSLDSILREVISGALNITDMKSGIIHLFNWINGKNLIERTFKYPRKSQYPDPRTIDNVPIGFTGKVAKFKQPIIVRDTFKFDGIREELFVNHHSSIGLPLLIEGKVIGALFLDDDKPHDFQDAELSRLNLLINQASAAINSAINHEKFVEVIDEISKIITASSEIDLVLNRILELTNILLGNASLAVIGLIDSSSNDISAKAVQGEVINPKFRRTIKVGEGVVGKVAENGKPILINDISKYKGEYFSLSENAQSELAVPIKNENEVIGVIDIYHNFIDGFSSKDLDLVTAISGLTTIAINNAKIYQAEIQRVEEIKLYIISLAHELQLPLESLLSSAEVLKLNDLTEHERDMAADLAINETELLSLKVKTAIAVLSGELPQRQFHKHNIRTLLFEARELFLNEAKDFGCVIKPPISIGGKFPIIEMCLDDLDSALKNLLHNAVKYSYSSREGKKRFIEIKGYWEDYMSREYYVISIQNYGIGITQEEIETRSIFNVFERGVLASDRERTGSGFGLAHASQIIESLHNGTINVTSLEKRGGAYLTTFYITLPVRQV